jgi:hypothetical protein
VALIFAHALDYAGGISSDTTFLRIVRPCIDVAVRGSIEGAAILREGNTMAELLGVSRCSHWKPT